jgi:hypothetical protein
MLTSPAPPGFADDAVVAEVRDSLYDRLPLTRRDRALMGTAALLRLDEVKQLGFIHRIWPGAKHTRFEHSLGMAYLAKQAIDALAAQPTIPGLPALTAADGRTLVAAALLHDVGHYAFSHCLEELGPPIEPHEVVGRRLIETADLADVLRADWRVAPERVANLIAPTAPLTGADALLGGLLSGALDLDKLDYLPRDAKACNVPYGRVDTPRLLSALRVRQVDGDSRIVVTDKGVSPLHSLINARQEMFDNVYWHHTNRACMVMLQRAVQEALLAGALHPARLIGLTDAALLALLNEPVMPAATRDLVARLGQRRIHKRGLEISSRAADLFDRLAERDQRADQRRATEHRLAAALRAASGQPIADHALLLDIPKPERWSTDVWISYARPPLGFEPLMHWTDAVGLGPEALRIYEEHQRRIRLVVDEAVLPLVEQHRALIVATLQRDA